MRSSTMLDSRGAEGERIRTDQTELVRRLRAGDVQAFEELYRAHSAELYRFALGYVRHSGVAEEIVQDVFFQIWQARARWDPSRPIASYLFVATRNRAIDHLRRERVVARLRADVEARGSQVPGMGTPAPTAQADLEAAEHRQRLEAGIAGLPARARLAFTLYWQHGLSYAEVADAMGIARKTVENQLAAALRALRRHLRTPDGNADR